MGRLENNLLSADNESFDASTGGWAANNNCTISRDISTFLSAPGSLKLTTTAAGFTNAILAGGVVLVQPSTTFTVGYQAFSTTAGLSCQINVDWYDGSGAYISSAATTAQPIGTSAWSPVSNVVTSPPTAAEARFTVGNFTATAAGQSVFVDDVLFAVAGPVTAVSYPGLPTWTVLPPAPVPVAQAQIERGNNFDSGSAGATITTANSGTAGGDPFGAVSIPSGGQAVFGDGGIARFSTRATAGACYGELGTSGNGLAGMQDSPVYLRLRLRMPTLPPDAAGIPFAVVTDSVSAFQCDFRVNSSGQLLLRSGAGATLATSTTTITAGLWFEVGCAITNVSATAGTLQLLIYDPLTGNVLEQLDGGGVDTLRGSGRQKIQLGMLRSLANAAVEFDVWRMSTTGYPPLAPATVLATVNEIGASAAVTGNATTVTTASYTPGSNSLLVALVAMGNGAGSASSLGAVSDNLSGTWTRLAGDVSTTGGDAEVWVRDVGAAAAMSITWDPGGAGASGLDLIVKNFSGAKAAASQTGATAVNGGTTSYAVALTTTVAGSVVAGSLGRATDAQTLTALAGSTILSQVNGTSGDTAGLFRATSITATPGAGTYGFGNAAAGTNRMALAEIVPVAVPAGALTVSGSAASTSLAAGDLTMVGSLAGTVSSLSSAAGAVTSTGILAGSATSTSVASGSVTTLSAVAGAAASTSSATGAVTAAGVLSGAAVSASAAAGAVTARGALSGAAASTSAATGNVTLPTGLTGAATSTSTAAGSITATGVLSGTAASTSAAAGSIVQGLAVTGSASSTSAATGALALLTPISGTAASTSLATGSLGLRTSVSGSAASASAAAGDLSRVTPISGTAASTSAATGDLTITSGPQTFPISGSATSTSSATGALTQRGVLAGAAASVSTATTSLGIRFTLAGAAASLSAAAGALTAQGVLAGTAASVSTATGSVTWRATIGGTATSLSAASGSLGMRLQLSGSAASTSVAVGDLVVVGPSSGITLRPNTGQTARPSGGTTPRPGSGTTARRASGITYRPNTGTTPRP